MSLSPVERRARASKAALTGWLNTVDRSARGRQGHAGLLAKFAREIDPDGTMNPAERARLVKTREKLHMADMQLKAAKARRRRAEERQERAADLKAARDAEVLNVKPAKRTRGVA